MSRARWFLWEMAGALTSYRRARFYTREFLDRPYDAGALQRVQDAKLRDLVHHAYHHVPYYRELFDREGLSPRDVRSPADLERIPVLTKEKLRDHFEQLFATNFDRGQVVVTSTGGSTGEPTHYAHDRRYMELSQTALMRSWTWSGWRPGELIAWVSGVDRERSPLVAAAHRLVSGKLLLNAFDVSDEGLAEWCELLRRHRPALYYGYASGLSLVARYATEHGIELPPARAAVTTAEKLYPEQVEEIEQGLRCPVRDFYGCREVMNVAATCGRGRMHQIVDMTVFSTQEDGGVVVTPLDSYAMPLLRYANGDVASTEESEACDCGLALPVMRLEVGRTTDFFVNGEGRRIHGEFFTHLMYGLQGVREFQFHQKAVDDVLLRVVLDGKRSGESLEQDLRRVREEVERRCSLPLRYEIVPDIPKTRVGKHLFTVSDVGCP